VKNHAATRLRFCHPYLLDSGFQFRHRYRPMIQVDIGGHPPFPNGSKQFSGHFGNLLFLAGFNFRGHFEGLNEGFSRLRFSMISKGMIEPPKLISSMIPFQRAITRLKRDRMQKLRPREVDAPTYPNGAHMTFGASSPRVRFLDV
jgi:hypothetical protein